MSRRIDSLFLDGVPALAVHLHPRLTVVVADAEQRQRVLDAAHAIADGAARGATVTGTLRVGSHRVAFSGDAADLGPELLVEVVEAASAHAAAADPAALDAQAEEVARAAHEVRVAQAALDAAAHPSPGAGDDGAPDPRAHRAELRLRLVELLEALGAVHATRGAVPDFALLERGTVLVGELAREGLLGPGSVRALLACLDPASPAGEPAGTDSVAAALLDEWQRMEAGGESAGRGSWTALADRRDAGIEAAHGERVFLEAEVQTRRSRRLRRQLDAAREAESLALAKAGYITYQDYLAGERARSSVVEAARAAAAEADPRPVELRGRIVDFLGEDPGADVEGALRSVRARPALPAGALAEFDARVGADPAGARPAPGHGPEDVVSAGVAQARLDAARDRFLAALAAQDAVRAAAGPGTPAGAAAVDFLEHRRALAHVLIVDDGWRGLDDAALRTRLPALVEAARREQVVYLTNDPRVLGWAQGLPLSDGAAVAVLATSWE